jgi:hypothetical protein
MTYLLFAFLDRRTEENNGSGLLIFYVLSEASDTDKDKTGHITNHNED